MDFVLDLFVGEGEAETVLEELLLVQVLNKICSRYLERLKVHSAGGTALQLLHSI